MNKQDWEEEARKRIRLAYAPELVKAAGQRLAERLAEHLADLYAQQKRVLNWQTPEEKTALAAAMLRQAEQAVGRGRLTEQAVVCNASDDSDSFAEINRPDELLKLLTERFDELVQVALEHGLNLHDPRYIGHQVPASVPVAGLFDAVGSVTNQVMAVYEMGPWATAVERALVDRLGEQIGWKPDSFAGMVTHGGSLANLTALLTARNVALKQVWETGLESSSASPVLVVHSDVHYSIARAAGVLGIGTRNVVPVGLDQKRRMRPDLLDQTLTQLEQQGRRPIAVAACACSTPIGAFDPLEEIADVCQRHRVWLHVDAAHGGSACFSRRFRHLVAGLDQADSIVWDAHKMLFMPALCAFVLYKNKEHRFEAFRQNAPYLFDPAAPGIADYDSGLKTLECTKRAAAFGLWGVWCLFGPQLLADLVDVTFTLGRRFYELLQEAPDFQPLHEPQCNIVVFRHVPKPLNDADPQTLGQFQLKLRRAVIESGSFYIVPIKLNGQGALRVTIINPLTTEAQLAELLEELRRQAHRLLHS